VANGNLRDNVDLFTLLAQPALRQLNHGVDLYAVLRAHLWLERDVLSLLRVGSPKENPKRGFYKKIERARKRGVLGESDFAFLAALNDVRNGFAHDLERETLTRSDDDALFDVSSEVIRTLYARLTVEVEEPETSRAEGLRFRGLLAAMHLHLSQRILDLKAGRL
jgi:hypothetical protein